MSSSVDGVVLVTGCSSGIGAAVVRELARTGHRVVATARRTESITSLQGESVLTHALDVSDSSSIEQAVAASLDWGQHIGMLINNAGFGLMGPTAEIRLEDLRRQLEVNVVGPVALVQAVVPHMARRRRGRIVNIGSVAGVTTTPFSGAYSASKAALHALDEALRMELARFAIEVITVQPGAVASRFAANASQGLERYRATDSLYHDVANSITVRAKLSQGNGITPERFARDVVRAVTSARPSAVIRLAPGSRLLPALQWLPRRLRERVLRRKFGLDGRQ